ncbi:DUF342 domain-containing protein [Clostridium saccharobutylicum]|uniref:Putative polymerase n=2 Tax=Clostridium saccharobutylicum TaxID=169679 RepID=U5MWI7_CLOSA|nr:FapA family protein [Clostridium saccharobutylicum]AGX44945.1 putative polymerase [Clostridium saccharobutylicum DSM 13864]AQR92227.1 hypothetical protein CLOSC_39570 [Clostridium saccharobutylicum]AQS02129.1 hypothetical protein CSACC_39620 [Clostridium saccharobutylicum]AQS11733.1 hypothetical protein CLOBY_38910 [Clostridium saccharobutylicum]AQS16112.1 hypothetical protein CLOSACC_39620 [Clostridium saccharobutylicum]
MALIFSSASLDQCLQKASNQLSISKESIKYIIKKEEKRFFKRKIEIEVLLDETENDINIDKNEIIELSKQGTDEEAFGARVEDGKIIIKDFEKSNDIITIKSCEGVDLFINDQKCGNITPVTVNDKIEYKFEEVDAIRNANIYITKDNMEAYITIKSIPKYEYRLIDQGYCKNLTLIKEVTNEIHVPQYSVSELKEILSAKGIKYGIIEEELRKVCNENEVNNVLVAKGLPVQNDISEEIRVLFKESDELVKYNDLEEKIDYRNRYLIAHAKAGDIIGEKIPGKIGKDGTDIFGSPIKKELASKLTFKIGSGCKLEDDKIIATIEGKPCFRAGIFSVNKLYKVDDVNLQTGNINFVGNIEVGGNVCESMEVISGNEVFVVKNVDTAKIKAAGQIVIGGNVIKSTIITGCENIERKKYLDNLLKYKKNIIDLIFFGKQIKASNLLDKKSDGEIIKILIENKFKALSKLSKEIFNYNLSEGFHEFDMTAFIINKLIGMGPLKIKGFVELEDFEETLEHEIETMELLEVIPADIYVQYVQGSTIESSGSVYVQGKGQYNSNIKSLNNIEFTNENAVCRGGVLTAGSEIKIKTVGSEAGIITVLKVPAKGRITADVAYNNTVFCFGEKKIVLDVSSKNIEAYVDEFDEITIDKFIL